MKTKTITLHDTDNFGSSLQAYALQRFLLDNNVENELIDYLPKYLYNHGKSTFIFARNILFFRDVRKKNERFKKFKKDYLNVTHDTYQTLEDLKQGNLSADVFLCGSDQLWNSNYLCGKDPAYYLNFLDNKDSKKVSYAVSLGKSDVPESELNWISENAKDFSKISVREESSSISLEKKLNKPVTVVCDPVFLLDKNRYFDIAAERIEEKPYAFLYLIEPSETLEKTIKYLREEKKLKIIVAGSYRKKSSADVNLRDLGPSEFLSLLIHADFILASSFHAVAFSLLLEKRFSAILPHKNQERIKHILGLIGLEDRIIDENSDISQCYCMPEYNKLSNKLSEFIDFSKKWLLDSLK
ncbi:TPA: polysaccharide pyruvyl transferase family protein [Enterococcus hirae]|nr:polysaccharide pyruvyl transferase family protein [Enterococcus hirae]